MREKLWTVADVADYLGVSVSWVYLHASKGDLPYLRVGGLLRFQPAAVQGYALGERQPLAAVMSIRPKG
jgi:excisionase family DNA binding protein